MALEPFQSATVDAAESALTDPTGSRRFLVADEVGLGKTIVAREVSLRLAEGRAAPLNVVYFCPSLGIASQNLKKLKALQPDGETPSDRLSLACTALRRGHVRWRISAYTPETSLPGWRAGGRRTGRWSERELIASLVRVFAHRSWRELRRRDRARGYCLFPEKPGGVEAGLARRVATAFRAVFDIGRGDLDEGLLDRIRSEDVWEFVLKARCALALTALRDPATRPDLLILDEFHRYADLVLPSDRDRRSANQVRVHELLRRALLGEDGRNTPAVLLMSATPYRLRRADGGTVPGGRYENFIALVRFLFGPGGAEAAAKAETAIRDHHAALSSSADRSASLEAVRSAKRRVEDALAPVIARTERATAIRGELFRRRELRGRVEADDLSIFGHMASGVGRSDPRLASWVTPLWSSIPYPAETMFDYAVSEGLTGEPCPVASGAAGARFAHPRLRACTTPSPQGPAAIDRAHLSLPWCPPTRPWWRLGGAWRRAESAGFGKVLLFSRYTGTPPSVAALLSRDAEGIVQGDGARPVKFSAQAFLKPTANPSALVASFLPLALLSCSVEVGPLAEGGRAEVVKRAVRSLRAALANRVPIVSEVPVRPVWRLALGLEVALGGRALLDVALGRLGRLRTRAQGLRSKDLLAVEVVGKDELEALCDWLVSTPGPVIARTLLRHQPAALSDARLHASAMDFCWGKMRPYLGQRYFGEAILDRRRAGPSDRFPTALRRAVLEGGLEAVLDEHLATMERVGEGTPLDHLNAAFIGRPGHVRLRGRSKTGRVHAVAPFAGADRRGGAARDGPLRSDALRRAFNGPFWPHVLVSTSVGQEGLDFHVWCDRIVHWDLPGDPVDFEQREGRVARYASLSVRRALAEASIPAVSRAQDPLSPFARIFASAAEAGSGGLGLERWWAPPGDHRPRSFTFATDFSMDTRRAQSLKAELARYRLALGQPEPELFVEVIRHLGLDAEEARGLALDLCPASRSTEMLRASARIKGGLAGASES